MDARLSDKRVRALKPEPRTRRYFDGGGLYLEVTPAGARLWRYKYRISGREKRLAIGVYPDVSLKAAREQHVEARKLVAAGTDPSAVKQATRRATADSFEVVAREFVEGQRPTWAPGHLRTIEQRLAKDVYPWLGPRPVADVSAADVLVLLRRIEKRGAGETAKRIKSICSQVMRYAVATQRADRDPVADLKGALAPRTPKPMAAVTDPAAVGALLRGIDGYAGTLVVCIALRMAPYVFVRPGELRAAEWSEFDLEAAEWVIPARRMKLRHAAKLDARRDHLVPLAPQVIELLRELEPLTGRGRYVFPSIRTPVRPMSENTVNAALRRLGYDKETMTGHGFRALASTRLNELGFEPDVIERQLAHTSGDKVRAAYNRARYAEDRRRMMVAWANYLDGLRDGADIVALRQEAV